MLKSRFSFIPCGYYFVAFYLYFEIFTVAARWVKFDSNLSRVKFEALG
ncbi:hypothetical protein CSUNSWCD_1674 [Campylobacter showae CSUNSWCD]|uniref:Uncharacterized protein n=1 Tax=Campylobacter showae CSUNSWCD TaxID=1244083 RepID=M5IR85_9BACT|nr:hypothetical protein CSUNSWCD_1674 [Campylobacter showae CSUNSWCD]